MGRSEGPPRRTEHPAASAVSFYGVDQACVTFLCPDVHFARDGMAHAVDWCAVGLRQTTSVNKLLALVCVRKIAYAQLSGNLFPVNLPFRGVAN